MAFLMRRPRKHAMTCTRCTGCCEWTRRPRFSETTRYDTSTESGFWTRRSLGSGLEIHHQMRCLNRIRFWYDEVKSLRTLNPSNTLTCALPISHLCKKFTLDWQANPPYLHCCLAGHQRLQVAETDKESDEESAHGKRRRPARLW